MKTTRFIKALVVALTGGLLLSGPTLATPATTLKAKKAINLSEFAGKYNGSLSVSAFGFTFPGTAVVKNRVPGSGRSAKVMISGSVQLGSIFPFGANLSLQPSGRCIISDIVLGTPLGVSGVGTYQQKSKNKIVGSASVTASGSTIKFDCTFVVKPAGGKKKKLVGILTMSVDGTPQATVSINAVGR